MKLIAATLICDRKHYHKLTALPHIFDIPEVDEVYINIESGYNNTRFVYSEMWDWLDEHATKPYGYDIWDVRLSNWRKTPEYDQHQVRLLPIVTARNMAIDYALAKQATHLLFIDSDVIPHPGGVKKLLELDAPLCGGLVPGRGAHKHVNYVFGAKRGIIDHGDFFQCDHGTCGYMLIKREVFSRLRFRWGSDLEQPGQMLSEDPAYCLDWYHLSGSRFLIHKEATADHIDDPEQPLTDEAAARDNWMVMSEPQADY